MERIETIIRSKRSYDNGVELPDDLRERINVLSEDDTNLLIDSLEFIDKPVTVKKTVRRAIISLNGFNSKAGVAITVSRNIYSIWTEIRKLLKDNNNSNTDSRSEYQELPDELKEKLGFTSDLSTVNENEIVERLERLYENVNTTDRVGELFFRFRLEDKSIGRYSPENTLIINANEYFNLLDDTIFPIDLGNMNIRETSWITPFVGIRINKYSTDAEYMVYYGYEIADAFTEDDARKFFTIKGKSDIKLSKFYGDQRSEYLNFWVFLKIVYERIRDLKPDIEVVCNEFFDTKNYIQNTLDRDIKDISRLIIDYIKS
jgi:hypothetical protein